MYTPLRAFLITHSEASLNICWKDCWPAIETSLSERHCSDRTPGHTCMHSLPDEDSFKQRVSKADQAGGTGEPHLSWMQTFQDDHSPGIFDGGCFVCTASVTYGLGLLHGHVRSCTLPLITSGPHFSRSEVLELRKMIQHLRNFTASLRSSALAALSARCYSMNS